MPIWIIIVLAVTGVINILVPLSGSTNVTPILAQHYSIKDAIAIASFLFALNALFRVWLFRKTLRMDMVWSILPYSILGSIVGSFLLGMINAKLLTFIVLILLFRFVFISIKRYSSKADATPKNTSKLGSGVLGIISGAIQGGGVTGGVDLRNGYLISKGLTIAELQGTTAVVGAGNFATATIVRLMSGTATFGALKSGLVLLPIFMGATVVGKYLLYRINKKIQQKLAICALILSIGLIINTLL